jgi:hypothetical protein
MSTQNKAKIIVAGDKMMKKNFGILGSIAVGLIIKNNLPVLHC